MLPTAPRAAALWAPLVRRPPAPPAALLWPWLTYARAMEAHYAALAQAQGEPFAAPSASDRLAAARLGAACGVPPWPEDGTRE